MAELRRTLQEAEVEEPLSETMVTMRVLKTASRERSSDLGPTLSVDVQFEGSPVSALIDTGSPVSIVSLQFLLRP